MTDDPDRDLACQEDLQDAFDKLARDASQKGWSERRISDALLALAVARIMGLEADADTRAAIRRAVDRIDRLN